MIPGISPLEMMILGMIALLLFGSKLPDVARSLGKGLTEFKRGIKGVQDEFNTALSDRPPPAKPKPRRPDPVDEPRQDWSPPRFEMPKSEPTSDADPPKTA